MGPQTVYTPRIAQARPRRALVTEADHKFGPDEDGRQGSAFAVPRVQDAPSDIEQDSPNSELAGQDLAPRPLAIVPATNGTDDASAGTVTGLAQAASAYGTVAGLSKSARRTCTSFCA